MMSRLHTQSWIPCTKCI